jgi:uncharacterized protein YdaU (DUF1376 family)
MSKSNHWMPFNVGDYIKDTRSLSQGEHGAYFLLLLEYWHKQAPLPLDQTKLYRLANATDLPEQKNVDSVLEQFFYRAEDGYHNNRMDADIAKHLDKIAKLKANGSKGGQAKAKANGSPIATANAEANGIANGIANGLTNDWQNAGISDTRSHESDCLKKHVSEQDYAGARAVFEKFAFDAVDYLQAAGKVDGNLDNLRGLLPAIVEKLQASRPDLTLDDLMDCWKNRVGVMVMQGKTLLWLKAAFSGRVMEYQPSQAAARPAPKLSHADQIIEALKQGKLIHNKFQPGKFYHGDVVEVVSVNGCYFVQTLDGEHIGGINQFEIAEEEP